MGCANVNTNVNGIPYISTKNVTVTDTQVNLALGFRPIPRVGYFTVLVRNMIPADTEGTLPIVLTLNTITRALTFYNGTPVTVADLLGTGVILVFNDSLDGILQMMSPLAAPAAATQNQETNS